MLTLSSFPFLKQLHFAAHHINMTGMSITNSVKLIIVQKPITMHVDLNITQI